MISLYKKYLVYFVIAFAPVIASTSEQPIQAAYDGGKGAVRELTDFLISSKQ